MSDGTPAGTRVLSELAYGVDHLTPGGSVLYFVASIAFNDAELWNSDCTEAGTVLVKDIRPSTGSFPRNLFFDGSTLYFQASDGTSGGGGGGGEASKLSSTYFPRSTGEVRAAYDVTVRMLPWPSKPARCVSGPSSTRRK